MLVRQIFKKTVLMCLAMESFWWYNEHHLGNFSV